MNISTATQIERADADLLTKLWKFRSGDTGAASKGVTKKYELVLHKATAALYKNLQLYLAQRKEFTNPG